MMTVDNNNLLPNMLLFVSGNTLTAQILERRLDLWQSGKRGIPHKWFNCMEIARLVIRHFQNFFFSQTQFIIYRRDFQKVAKSMTFDKRNFFLSAIFWNWKCPTFHNKQNPWINLFYSHFNTNKSYSHYKHLALSTFYVELAPELTGPLTRG